jgi:hypothetical protein
MRTGSRRAATPSLAARELERRGRAMRAFCDTVRARGGIAEVEENIDLPTLRAVWVIARAGEIELSEQRRA